MDHYNNHIQQMKFTSRSNSSGTSKSRRRRQHARGTKCTLYLFNKKSKIRIDPTWKPVLQCFWACTLGALTASPVDVEVDWTEGAKSGFVKLLILVEALFPSSTNTCCLGWMCKEDESCCPCCELVDPIICKDDINNVGRQTSNPQHIHNQQRPKSRPHTVLCQIQSSKPHW